MLPSHGEHAFKKEGFSAAGEARACCGIMSSKEFLIVASIFLIVCDLCDIYGNVVRVTGWTHLPFPGNITEMYYTQIKELNWYDLIISIIDAWCTMLLCLAVCAESLDGLVCSLCGFASSMILELVYVLWLSTLVFADSVEEVGDAHTAAQLLFSDRDAESRPQSLRLRAGPVSLPLACCLPSLAALHRATHVRAFAEIGGQPVGTAARVHDHAVLGIADDPRLCAREGTGLSEGSAAHRRVEENDGREAQAAA